MRRLPLIALVLGLVAASGVLIAVVAARTAAPRPLDPVARNFSLTDHNGQRLELASLRGRPVLVFFGFTFCPDVCPTELGTVAAVLRALGPDADRIAVVFISVDPGRDTAAKIKDFVHLFDPRIIGCTGTQAEIAATAASFGVWFKRSDAVAKDPTWYLIDHSATTYVLDREGRWSGSIDSHTPIATAVDTIRRLL